MTLHITMTAKTDEPDVLAVKENIANELERLGLTQICVETVEPRQMRLEDGTVLCDPAVRHGKDKLTKHEGE